MNYAVVGLGHFGFHIAKGLAEQGNRVVAIDSCEDRIKDISSLIENAYTLDSTDIVALKEAGIVEFDVVVVSLGDNIEASILTVMALKDLGNKTVIAKAKNAIHGEILAKIGATKIVYPEREMAKKVVKDISKVVLLDTIDISNTFKGIKFLAPKSMLGKSAEKLDLGKYSIKVSAIKKEEKWLIEFVGETIEEETLLFCVGRKKHIESFISEVLK